MSLRNDSIMAAAVFFLVAIFGFIFNILGISIVLKNPLLKNAFGKMCLSHSIANIGVMFGFFVWVAPLTLMQTKNPINLINKMAGQVINMCWDACVYSHLSISINRLTAIAFPAKAIKIFSTRNTYTVIGCVWCISFIHAFPYFWYDSCYLKYDPISWTWNFADTPCGYVISTYFDFYSSTTMFTSMLVIDSITLSLLIFHRKQTNISIIGSREAAKQRKTEIRFFMQSCLQGLLFFYEVFNFYYISSFNNSKWYIFFTTTFAWEICHCLDGFVVVLFHFRWSLFISSVNQVQKMEQSKTTATSAKRV